MYDRFLEKQIGARYFDNLFFNSLHIEDDNIVIVNIENEKLTVPVSSFTATSLDQDSLTARKLREIEYQKIEDKLTAQEDLLVEDTTEPQLQKGIMNALPVFAIILGITYIVRRKKRK